MCCMWRIGEDGDVVGAGVLQYGQGEMGSMSVNKQDTFFSIWRLVSRLLVKDSDPFSCNSASTIVEVMKEVTALVLQKETGHHTSI